MIQTLLVPGQTCCVDETEVDEIQNICTPPHIAHLVMFLHYKRQWLESNI